MKAYEQALSVRLVRSGSEYFAELLRLIDEAERVLHIQTYIFENDETGRSVASALKGAAGRGVAVFVLADAYGSSGMSGNLVRELHEAGVRFRFFAPIFSTENYHVGRRLHHKVAVADGTRALTGGINIGDRYRGTDTLAPWLDFAVWLEGAVCAHLEDICEQLYTGKIQGGKRRRQKAWRSAARKERAAVDVRFRRNDWMRARREISASYKSALRTAQGSVILVASYFLPGYSLRRHLTRAARRGVDVRIMVTGRSDVPFARQAEKFNYRHLLSHGIRIFEWPESVMHGKAMTVDDNWTTIGSYNPNHLSDYLSVELNTDIRDTSFASSFAEELRQLMDTRCREVDKAAYTGVRRSRWRELRAAFSYYLIRFIWLLLMPSRRHRSR